MKTPTVSDVLSRLSLVAQYLLIQPLGSREIETAMEGLARCERELRELKIAALRRERGVHQEEGP
jgi:hypothetical protein